MADTQPSAIHEGDQAPEAIPGSTHSQAAALSALDAHATQTSASRAADSAALGDAMKNLSVEEAGQEGKDVTKNVKVDLADVNLLAERLDVSKARATQLLKANGADAVKAVRAWIAA